MTTERSNRPATPAATPAPSRPAPSPPRTTPAPRPAGGPALPLSGSASRPRDPNTRYISIKIAGLGPDRAVELPLPRNVKPGATVEIPLTTALRRQAIPGLELRQVKVTLNDSLLPIAGSVAVRPAVPFLHNGGKEIKFDINENGEISLNIDAPISIRGIGQANLNLSVQNNTIQGSTEITPEAIFLKSLRATLHYQDGVLDGSLILTPTGLSLPFPGLTVDNVHGQLNFSSNAQGQGEVSGNGGATFNYRGLGQVVLDIGYDRNKGLIAQGDLQVNTGGLQAVSGHVQYRPGDKILFGEATLNRQVFPKAVRPDESSIKVRWINGKVEGSGSASLRLGSIGRGTFKFSYEQGNPNLGTDIQLNIPGLRKGSINIHYTNGQLEGEIFIPIDSERYKELSGNVRVIYKEGRFGGEVGINFTRGKELSGTITVRVEQLPDNRIVISGSGDVAAYIPSLIKGQAHVELTQDGYINVETDIRVPNDIQVIPYKGFGKQKSSPRIDIPLWGFTVPVVHKYVGIVAFIQFGGGFFLFVGPGVLRNVGVHANFGTQPGVTPAFDVSGELFVPAGAEVFGFVIGGVTLGALIVDIEGSIIVQLGLGATASLSVIPHIGYENGHFYIRGTMDLVVVPYLRLSGSARAAISVPVWGDVWDHEWPLFDLVFPLPLQLSMRGRMDYNFGESFAPNFSLEYPEIDATDMVKKMIPGRSSPPNLGKSPQPAPTGHLTSDPVPAPPAPPPAPAGAKPARRAAQPARHLGTPGQPGPSARPVTIGAGGKSAAPGRPSLTVPAPPPSRRRTTAAPAQQPGAQPAGAGKPGTPGPVKNPTPIDRPVNFRGHRHTLRVEFDRNGNASILMASNGFDEPIAQLMRDLQDFRTQYNSIFNGNTSVHTQLDEKFRQIASKKQEIFRQGASANPASKKLIYEDGLDELKELIEELGKFIVQTFGHLLGAGAAVKVNDLIYSVKDTMNLTVESIGVIRGAVVRQTREVQFGIQTRDGKFFLYDDFNKTWRTPGARPAYRGFTGSPGAGTRQALSVDRIYPPGNEAAKNLAFPGLNLPVSPTNPVLRNRKGHLVAQQFGGTGGFENIVAMTENANHTGAGMPGIEGKVNADIKNPALTRVFTYKVTPIYANPGNFAHEAPIAIEVEAYEEWPVPNLTTPLYRLRVDNTK
ncbi:MAG TPA: DNA/RNA non-specific endonuclease [Chloroflexia bacterium]|nr:DNA/RNA non-specific endonuclease [Chloroflexia bacterium]